MQIRDVRDRQAMSCNSYHLLYDWGGPRAQNKPDRVSEEDLK